MRKEERNRERKGMRVNEIEREKERETEQGRNKVRKAMKRKHHGSYCYGNCFAAVVSAFGNRAEMALSPLYAFHTHLTHACFPHSISFHQAAFILTDCARWPPRACLSISVLRGALKPRYDGFLLTTHFSSSTDDGRFRH